MSPFDTISSPTLGLQVGPGIYDPGFRVECEGEPQSPVEIGLVGVITFVEHGYHVTDRVDERGQLVGRDRRRGL